MKICWDNLEKLRYNSKTGKWYKGTHSYIYMNSCNTCKEPYMKRTHSLGGFCDYLCSNKNRKYSFKTRQKMSASKKGKNNPMYGKFHSEKSNIKRSNSLKGEKCYNWKGGYSKKNIPLYDTYAHQIEYIEEIRRDMKDNNVLQVKCTYCGKWHTPNVKDICNRIRFLNGKYSRESRFYCSPECKKECPIFNQKKYPKGHKGINSREVQPELRQMVFERDSYKCTKCKSEKSLHCHHKEGIFWEPLQSADIEMCITVCKKCHKKIHKKEGCTYADMQCKRN